MERIIFHIDVNSAYLSWTAVEQLKHGETVDIRTIPAIIGGDRKSRHGVVLAKSIPAKKYGIRTGEPVTDALRKCPFLHMDPPDHELYRQYSRRLMDFLHTYTSEIEQVSVDECYLDFTGIAGQFPSPVEAAFEMKDRIKELFGFTVNIGISCNKLLAKMASDFQKPDRVHTLFPQEIRDKMWPLPVSELYMAGRSSVETLKKLEITTIGELARTDPALIELHLKSHGRMLWEFANGMDDSPVQSEETQAKGIGNSTTLPKDVTKTEEAEKVLEKLAESVSRRLNEAVQTAGMVSVEIKYSTFQSVSHQMQLSRPSSEKKEIFRTACVLFGELWNGEPVRLLGIRTSKLESAGAPRQMSLFDLPPVEKKEKPEKKLSPEKKKKLEEAMETIRARYGDNAVVKGKDMKNPRR